MNHHLKLLLGKAPDTFGTIFILLRLWQGSHQLLGLMTISMMKIYALSKIMN